MYARCEKCGATRCMSHPGPCPVCGNDSTVWLRFELGGRQFCWYCGGLSVLDYGGGRVAICPIERAEREAREFLAKIAERPGIRRASPRPEDRELVACLTRAAASGVGILF